jgi:hypothetical protein
VKYIAPTDVTDPPEGWEWAKKEAVAFNVKSGQCRYVVTQNAHGSVRVSDEILEGDEANALMRQWNDEAKQ